MKKPGLIANSFRLYLLVFFQFMIPTKREIALCEILDGIEFTFSFLIIVEPILNLYDPITQSFVECICPLIPTWGIQIKLSSTWKILFYAFHQTKPITFSVIDAVNKDPANVYAFIYFIRKHNGSPYQIIFYHCLI